MTVSIDFWALVSAMGILAYFLYSRHYGFSALPKEEKTDLVFIVITEDEAVLADSLGLRSHIKRMGDSFLIDKTNHRRLVMARRRAAVANNGSALSDIITNIRYFFKI